MSHRKLSIKKLVWKVTGSLFATPWVRNAKLVAIWNNHILTSGFFSIENHLSVPTNMSWSSISVQMLTNNNHPIHTLTTCMDSLWLAVPSANNNQSWEEEREPGRHWWETKKEGRTVQTQTVPSSYHLHTVVGTAENGWDLLLKTHTLTSIHFSKSKFWILVLKLP